MSKSAALTSFISAAPPGELSNVTTAIRSITNNDSSVFNSLEKAFKKYNEEQFTTVKLPGSSQPVLISAFNELEDGRYFDVESATSFAFDHETQKASASQSYVPESRNLDLIKSLIKNFGAHAKEHFPTSTIGVFPAENDSEVAIALVANKYSPNNFWNGRYRFLVLYSPSNSSLTGSIKIDVHYYEDGNVRLLTTKPFQQTLSSGASAADIVRQIAGIERKYQEEVNRGFAGLAEGAFKGLRRQLPVTRMRVEWEKVGGYRLGQDIGGGRK